MLRFSLRLLFLATCIEIISCDNKNKIDTSLKSWVLTNQRQLTRDIDSILQQRIHTKSLSPKWISIGIVNTIYADNSLAELAKKAGDSTNCIVVMVTLYNDPGIKRRIMLAAEDSTCFRKLQSIKLDADSTSDFVFGKESKLLY